MAMQADKKHQWKFNVQAKAKNFDFKFKASSSEPTWKFHRISLLLRLRKLLFKINSDSGTEKIPKQHQPRSPKSKFLRNLEKIRARRSKNHENAAKNIPNSPDPQSKFPLNTSRRFAYEEPICVGSPIAGVLAFLCRSGILIYTSISIILLFLALQIKKKVTGKTRNLLLLLVVAAMACALMFEFKGYLNCGEGYVSKYIRKIWNNAASSG